MKHRHSDVDPEETTLVSRSEIGVDERFDERIRASNDDWKLPAAENRFQRNGGHRAEIGGGEVRFGVGDAEEVVRDAAALLVGDLVGGDVEAAVDLHFVGVDYLRREASGEVDGEAGFAGAGGAHHHHDFVLLAEELVVGGGNVQQRPYLLGYSKRHFYFLLKKINKY